MKTNNVVSDLNILLSCRFTDFKGLYLYGSNINELINSSSDIDVVAIFENEGRYNDNNVWDSILEIEWKYDIVFDLHPMTQDELTRNPFYYKEVTKKGLYYSAR